MLLAVWWFSVLLNIILCDSTSLGTNYANFIKQDSCTHTHEVRGGELADGVNQPVLGGSRLLPLPR